MKTIFQNVLYMLKTSSFLYILRMFLWGFCERYRNIPSYHFENVENVILECFVHVETVQFLYVLRIFLWGFCEHYMNILSYHFENIMKTLVRKVLHMLKLSSFFMFEEHSNQPLS